MKAIVRFSGVVTVACLAGAGAMQFLTAFTTAFDPPYAVIDKSSDQASFIYGAALGLLIAFFLRPWGRGASLKSNTGPMVISVADGIRDGFIESRNVMVKAEHTTPVSKR